MDASRDAKRTDAVWAAGFVIEAALRVVLIYHTSTGTVLAISKVTPFFWFAALSAWTAAYGTHQKKKGERSAAATEGVRQGG